MIPDDPPHDYASLMRLERTRLLALIRSLADADWWSATPCPGWTVLDLVNHLVGNDLAVISRQRDQHHGTPAPDGLDERAFIGWLDDLQNGWVIAARRISPRLAVELLDWLNAPVADTFAAHDPTARTAHVSWASNSPVPVWLDQARELSERWIHRQQLLEALRLPSDLGETIAGPVLDALRHAYPYRLEAARSRERSVEISISGELDRLWRLARRPGGWAFADDVGSPSATMSMTSEQAWRLLTNNYDPSAHGRLQPRGDSVVIDVLLRTRAIIGTPRMR
jgi:uncharacterized protein (TIGR03083 family)